MVTECGHLNNGNDQPALRALFACESGFHIKPEIGLDHAFDVRAEIQARRKNN